MTKKNATQAVVAALVCALTAGAGIAVPAIALAEPEPAEVAIVAQCVGECVSSDDAIDAAVIACPVGWDSVAAIDWDYEPVNDDYVVTVTAYSGAQWTVWVDAASGIAYAIA